jgi:hypothetical protein
MVAQSDFSIMRKTSLPLKCSGYFLIIKKLKYAMNGIKASILDFIALRNHFNHKSNERSGSH